MAIRLHISIRSKILAVLSVVVIAAVALYLYLASRIFYEDKILLIYELNQTQVKTLGAEAESKLARITDKLELLSHHPEMISSIATEDADFVRITDYRQSSDGQWKSNQLGIWPERLKEFHKDGSYLDLVRQEHPLPFEKGESPKLWIKNVTLKGEDHPPLMTIAYRIDSKMPSYLVGEVKLDSLIRNFSQTGVTQAFLVDSTGKSLLSNQVLRDDPLVQSAQRSKVRSEVKRFNENDRSFLGAFYKLAQGEIIVGTKIELEEAFAAARLLLQKSILYALIVVTAAFLIALIFSHTLTEPIQRMVEATRKIARGDFNLKVPISSGDELALLAQSFNLMTTGLRSSRQQIEEYSRDLEKKVIERTEKLEAQNIAIKEAQEALVRTTRLASVGEIAGRAAHEVLNPLTNISSRLEKLQNQLLKQTKEDNQLLEEISLGWATTLKDQGTDGLFKELASESRAQAGKKLVEEDLSNLQAIAKDMKSRTDTLQSDLEFLFREAGRISKIVNGMRQLTRISGSRTKIELTAFIQEALATMNDLLAKHGIKTSSEADPSNPVVIGDPDELLQIFSNLLRNSMQALDEAAAKGQTPSAGGRIWIKTRVESDQVWIDLSDNGPGIKAENFEKVFEPNFTTKSVEDGTGLGLSICRRLLRGMGGDIAILKSEAGIETTFRITLPEKTHG